MGGKHIISKVLANRLRKILPTIISDTQNAFVPGRAIQDNLLVAHKVFHYLKTKRKGLVNDLGLKLDMSKAYDRVEWDFLEATMSRMGFCDQWIRLIMLCISSVSFSVMLNGKPGRFFKPSRGIRQGDPLSTYLFLLISEVLSRNIALAVNDKSLRGLKISRRGPCPSHLFFADDSLFFLRATERNCQRLIEILDCYSHASGQQINH